MEETRVPWWRLVSKTFTRLNMALGYLLLVCFTIWLQAVVARPTYQATIPFGAITGGLKNNAFGHTSTGGYSQFGRDYNANGRVWDSVLCNKDSDGDGLTNGEELGDPNCTWRVGDSLSGLVYQSDPSEICDPVCPTPSPTESPTPAPITEPIDVEIPWFVPSEFPDLEFAGEYFVSEEDNLVFQVSGDSNIIKYSSKDDFDSCSSSGFTVLASSVSNGQEITSISIDQAVMYLSSSTISGNSTHCELGQKVTINAFSRGIEVSPGAWSIRTIDPIVREPSDVLSILVGAGHDLYRFPDEDAFDACDFDNATLIYDGEVDGEDTITLRDSTADVGDKRFYGCSKGLNNLHCNNGQKVQVTVVDVLEPDEDNDDDDDDNDENPSFNSTPANVLMLLTGLSLSLGFVLLAHTKWVNKRNVPIATRYEPTVRF